jgi:cell shape-determining protein MreC
MKYFNFLKKFLIKFLIIFLIFIIFYFFLDYLVDLGIKKPNFIMGGIISFLITIMDTITNIKHEKTEELIRSNYWKLKNELHKKVNKKNK